MLTLQRLHEVTIYLPLTGEFLWRVTLGRRAQAGNQAGYIHSSGYRVIKIDTTPYIASRLAWLYMKGEWPTGDVDHKDTDRSNNAWDNLRDLSSANNQQNKHGANGVTPVGNRHRARITVGGNTLSLGTYDTYEEAHSEWLRAKRQYHPFSTL